MNKWSRTGQLTCKSCGHVIHKAEVFIDTFFHPAMCEVCGCRDGWKVNRYTYRYVSVSVWWKPWTWLLLSEERKDESTDEPGN